MDRDREEGNESSVYVYNGVGAVQAPDDVITHVRVGSSVTVIPESAFQEHRKLEVVELPTRRAN